MDSAFKEDALALARRLFERIPHSRALGIQAIDVAEGVVVAMVAYQPHLVGNAFTGSMHGGVVTTLIDQTSGAAVISRLGSRQSVATLDLRIDHLRATAPEKPLYARAECYRMAASIAFVRCTAYQHEGTPVATSMSCFMRMGLPDGRNTKDEA